MVLTRSQNALVVNITFLIERITVGEFNFHILTLGYMIGWLVLWCLAPLSAILQLHRGGQYIGGGTLSARRKSPTCRKSLTSFITQCIEYTLQWTRFEPTTLVVIGNDFIGSCKSNYHTITTMAAPKLGYIMKKIST